MKKIFSMFVFVCFALGILFGVNNYSQNVFAVNQTEYVTIITQTYIYKDSNLKSEIYKKDNEYFALSVGTTLKLDNSTQDDHKLFYKVHLYEIIDNASETDVGYVLKAHALDSSIKSPQKKLDDNAKIKIDNAILYLYDQVNNNYIQQNITLQKDTKVRILDGYDTNKEYTYISYQKDDGEIMSYYIKTTDLSVSGINYSVIIAISLLITCCAIIGIIVGIKRKKAKK